MEKILNKISRGKKLTDRENRFIELYKSTNIDIKDHMMISKNVAFTKIKDIISKGISVICNLKDRDGKFGLPILDLENDNHSEECKVIMKNEEWYLHDRFLYNLIWDDKKISYSLEEHDEYYEKIEIKK